MPLSDIEIRAEIDAKRLVFEPPIGERERIGSSSVDLLLHKNCSFCRRGRRER